VGVKSLLTAEVEVSLSLVRENSGSFRARRLVGRRDESNNLIGARSLPRPLKGVRKESSGIICRERSRLNELRVSKPVRVSRRGDFIPVMLPVLNGDGSVKVEASNLGVGKNLWKSVLLSK
jgi:hypothetical protein